MGAVDEGFGALGQEDWWRMGEVERWGEGVLGGVGGFRRSGG